MFSRTFGRHTVTHAHTHTHTHTHTHSCEPTPDEYSTCQALVGRGSTHYYPQFLPGLDGVFEGFSVNVAIVVLRQFRPPPPEECIEFARHLMCLVAAPPCEADTGLPLVLCNETCEAYGRLLSVGYCQSLDEHIRSAQRTSLLSDFGVLADKYFEFNCSNVSTYIFDSNKTEFATSSCSQLFSPQTTGTVHV